MKTGERTSCGWCSQAEITPFAINLSISLLMTALSVAFILGVNVCIWSNTPTSPLHSNFAPAINSTISRSDVICFHSSKKDVIYTPQSSGHMHSTFVQVLEGPSCIHPPSSLRTVVLILAKLVAELDVPFRLSLDILSVTLGTHS